METDERDPHRFGLDDSDRREADRSREVDPTLRELLEPNPFVVERLVANALRQGEGPVPGVRWWPRVVAAAALLAALVFLIPDPSLEPPPGGDTPTEDRAVASAEPVRISISNDDGYVTISSTLGSKWILVSGDNS